MSVPLRLLLIEDSARDVALLVRLLRREGHDVVFEQVETSEAMRDALDRQGWDLVIADHSMPAFGAEAALEMLRQRDLDVPLLIVSGTISEEAAVECMKRGAADYLLKDRLSRLGEAVQRALADQYLRTEKRQADRQIRFQALLLEAVEQAVIATDLDGMITYWNHFAERLYGWPARAVLGRDILGVTPAPADRDHVAAIMAGLRAGASWSGEYLVQRQDGHTFPASTTNSPIHDERGTLVGIVGVSSDITERTRARQETERARAAAEELARVRSDLVAAVSHELRTPLTTIIGMGELLQARWPHIVEPKWQATIARIVSAAHRQQRLVEDLLLLSKLDAEVLETDCRPVVISALAHRAAAEVRDSYPGQRIEIEGDARAVAMADPDRTMQVLANLMDNAAKYSPESAPITVSWTREGPVMLLRVRDQGPGIPTEGRERLFTRFGRVSGSRMRAGHVGTGLGLYLSRALARAMGGDLEIEETGPEGSIFRLRLPAYVAAHTTSEPAASASPGA